MDSVMKTGEHLETTRSVQLEDENYVVPERTTNLRRRSANKKERHERSRRGRKPSRPERLLNESTEEVGVDESNQEMHLDNSVINNASHDEKHANDIDDLQQQHDDSKALQDIVDAKSILDATSLAGASMQASSVLQALGLARSVSNGVGYGINLGNNKSLTDVGNSSVMNNSQSVSTKTVPLLVNMKASAQAVPSILPANLPPGRYVIISSTTTPSTSTTQQQALTTTPTTTTQSSHSTSSSNPVVDLAAALKANQNLSASNHNSSRLSGLARNSGGGSSAAPSSHHHHHVRTPVGKTRGMRKSYTTSEKLAMIEAVESGLKKSVVADRFGVAPSTLACIILQKDKIRRDQTKTNSMGRRRIRPSSNLSRLDLAGAHGSSGYSGSSTGAASATSRDQSSPTPDQQHAAGNSSALLQRCSSLSPYSSMAASYASLSSVLSSSGFLGGIEAAAVAAAAAARPTLPFTHFLANFDQSLGYDANQPEEIVSVPDLSESMSGFGSGGNSSSTPITNFKSEDNATVDKRAPSAQETDCGAEETMEEGVPGTLSEEEEDCNEASMTEVASATGSNTAMMSMRAAGLTDALLSTMDELQDSEPQQPLHLPSPEREDMSVSSSNDGSFLENDSSDDSNEGGNPELNWHSGSDEIRHLLKNYSEAVKLDKNQWTEVTRNERQTNFIKHERCQMFDNMKDVTPSDVYQLIADDNIVNLLVNGTNQYAEYHITNFPMKDSSRKKDWYPTTHSEIRKLLGVLMYMELVGRPDINLYWRTKGIYECPIIRKCITRDRFQIILRFLDVTCADIYSKHPNVDNLSVQPLIDELVKNFQELRPADEELVLNNYEVPRNLSYDVEYLNNVITHKNKISLLTISNTDSYVWNVQIFGNGFPLQDFPKHKNVAVINLLARLLGKGRTIFGDLHFSSIQLTQFLLANQTYYCSPIQQAKKGLPPQVVHAKLRKGELMGRQLDGVKVYKWKSAQSIMLISSVPEHCLSSTYVGKFDRPQCIVDYYKSRKNLVKQSQTSSFNTVLKKVGRWQTKIIVELLTNITVVNAWILYNEMTGSEMSIMQFKESLVEDLLSKDIPPLRTDGVVTTHTLQEVDGSKGKCRRRCRLCYEKISKVEGSKKASMFAKKVTTYCGVCEGKPFYCLSCFNEKHAFL